MRGVVPAAGEGTRLRPLTADRPKSLVEVAGRPLIAHAFETLIDLGVKEVVVVVPPVDDQLRTRFGQAYEGIPLHYVEQPEPRGLADAVRCAEPLIDDDFVVYNSDNVVDADLGPLVERHRAADAAATLSVQNVTPDRAAEGGVLVFEDDELVGVVEKPSDPPSSWVTRGCHVLSPVVFHACYLVTPGDTGEYELSAAFDLLLRAGQPVETVHLGGRWVNVNTPADIHAAEALLAE